MGLREESASGSIPLTVIIPVHDRQQQFEKALQSVAAQPVRPRRVVVVDDGSATPVTIPKEPGERLDITLIRQANKGAAAARNTGLKTAATDWVAFLDSDDVWVSGTLEDRWRTVSVDQARKRDPKVIYGWSWIDRDETGRYLTKRHPCGSDDPGDFAAGCWFSPGSCIMLNGAEAVGRAGYQDETLQRLEDYDWFLALGLQGFRLSVHPDVCAKIEIRRQVDPERLENALRALRCKWSHRLAQARLLNRMNSYFDLEAASANYYKGHRAKAAFLIARSLWTYPRLSLSTTPGWVIERD